MVYTEPRTWTAGEKPTAATFNVHVRDNFKAIGDSWTAWIPAWTAQITDPAIGNGSIVGGYVQAGKLIHFRITLTIGTTTTFGSGAWELDLPVGELASARWLFTGVARDSSLVESWAIFAERTAANLLTLRRLGSGAFGSFSSTLPFAWANGDTLDLSGTYEAA